MLDILVECKKINKDFDKIADECETLSEYYNPARYPMDIPGSFAQEKGEEAIKMTQRVIKFIKNKI